MIKRLKYNEIDFEKYNNCIENAVQKNFFAKKEILDFLTPTWELLIYNDYQFVMPIPIKKKWGLKIVISPLFCQQLGVFSKENNRVVEGVFLDYFVNKYHYFYYPFNSKNEINNAVTKKNYVIQKTEYSILRKKYFKGRKSTVKMAQHLIFKEISLDDELLIFIKNHQKGLEKKSDFIFYVNYLSFLFDKKHLKLYGAYQKENLLNVALIIETDHCNYLLSLINDTKNIKNDGASFLIDQILQKSISAKNFSFMGSSIRGIEVFFKSFGSELEEFPIIENSKTSLMRSLFNI